MDEKIAAFTLPPNSALYHESGAHTSGLCTRLQAVFEAAGKSQKNRALYACGPTFPLPGCSLCSMAPLNDPDSKSMSAIIDHIERIREELLTVQRSLEKIAPVEADPLKDGE